MSPKKNSQICTLFRRAMPCDDELRLNAMGAAIWYIVDCIGALRPMIESKILVELVLVYIGITNTVGLINLFAGNLHKGTS